MAEAISKKNGSNLKNEEAGEIWIPHCDVGIKSIFRALRSFLIDMFIALGNEEDQPSTSKMEPIKLIENFIESHKMMQSKNKTKHSNLIK